MKTEAMAKVWFNKALYDNAEKLYYERLCNVTKPNNCSVLVSEIAKAREHIQNSLEKIDDGLSFETGSNSEVLSRVSQLEADTKEIKKLLAGFTESFKNVLQRLAAVENNTPKSEKKEEEEADDDVDLFASDSEEEDEEKQRIREERLSKYAEKKATKTALIAKSTIVLDVKPWDDEVDLKQIESKTRGISSDGLIWGASKFQPVAFGVQKLTISCVVEDEKISVDWLIEEIEKFDELVQSVDIVSFNKV
ncbi:hypothetical protein KR222_001759 [Zaprionus bogoriensis]|nr:hypothetical protein KR222_001759 [Zaprionus bogoriensis]